MRKFKNIIAALQTKENLQAVIFDMDGLIFDTERCFMEQLSVVMGERGYRLDRNIYTNTLGLGGVRLKEYMESVYGQEYPFQECSREAARRMGIICDTVGFQVKPEIPETLEYLKKRNVVCGVASSTKSESVKKYLDKAGLAGYFDEIVGGEMVSVSKPAPDIFLLACEKINSLPENVLVLEDSVNGIKSAYAAGIPVVWVPDLVMPTEEIAKLTYGVVIRNGGI